MCDPNFHDDANLVHTWPYPQPDTITSRYALESASSPIPTSGATIFLFPNIFQAGRANLAWFSWDGSDATVNLKGVVDPNSDFVLLDPQNFYGAPVWYASTDSAGLTTLPSYNLFNVYVVVGDPNSNMMPVVDAGPDQTVRIPTTSVTLSGSVSDDGKPNPPHATTITWSQVSGPACSIVSPHTAGTSVNLTGGPGIYVFKLSASDSAADSNDIVQVTLLGNQAPVVSAGADQAIQAPFITVSLAGTVSDDGLPIGAAVSYTWTKTSGPGTVTFTSANALTPTATFSATGAYVLRLTATDTALTAYAECSVMVNGAVGGQPYGGTPWYVPGTILAVNYDLGGEGIAYHDTSPTLNTGGGYRPTEGVDIRAINNDPNQGWLVKDIAIGEWLNYTINVAVTTDYTFGITAATDANGCTMHFEVDGADVTGPIAILPSGDYNTGLLSTGPTPVTLAAGIHVLKACWDTDGNGPAGSHLTFNAISYQINTLAPVNLPPIITMPANITTAMPGAAAAGADHPQRHRDG